MVILNPSPHLWSRFKDYVDGKKTSLSLSLSIRGGKSECVLIAPPPKREHVRVKMGLRGGGEMGAAAAAAAFGHARRSFNGKAMLRD